MLGQEIGNWRIESKIGMIVSAVPSTTAFGTERVLPSCV